MWCQSRTQTSRSKADAKRPTRLRPDPRPEPSDAVASVVALNNDRLGFAGVCSIRFAGRYRAGMAVPDRTVEQRRAASQWAVLARRRRAEVAGQVKAGALSLPDLLDLARTDEAVAAMRVSAVVESLPRMGPRRAEEAMLRLRVSPSRRLRGLGSAQRVALIALAARSPK